MKNLLVAQSGGPTSAINATLAGVIENALSSPSVDKIYGSVNGIQGVLNENLIDLKTKITNVSELDLLCQTPASALGSCRVKLKDPAVCADEYETIISVLRKYSIDCFIYIGGNDSMDTVSKLSRYAETVNSEIRFIGIPKTIDNDLVLTDHTPGFGSAAKYVASTVREIAIDASVYDNKKSVTIVEIMGRHAGWLAAASVLARKFEGDNPVLIYLPEVAFSKEQFLADVKDKLTKQKTVIVAVSEGIHDADGNYISSDSAVADKFGHAQLSGAGKALEYLVRDEIGVKVRSIELNVLQRCAGHIASRTDITESFSLGQAAVKYAAEGKTGIMAAIERISNDPYQWVIKSADVADIANEAKSVPVEWINEAGNDVTDEMIDYLRPLIIGEVSLQYKDGLPVYLPVDHLLH